MTVTRRDILSSVEARDRFLTAVVELNRPTTGMTASDLLRFLRPRLPWFLIQGEDQELSIWDLFVVWHYVAMQMVGLPLAPLRNLAHGGPIFLPWHRMYLIRLEELIQTVTGDADAALPYWDWAAHGELPLEAQPGGALWSEAYLGESRGQVTSGILGNMRVRLEQRLDGLWSVPERRLERDAGNAEDAPGLPRRDHVRWVLEDGVYDGPAWHAGALGSFRNKVEGWLQPPPTPESPAPPEPQPQLHNRVHVWVGGDMGPGTSPNDPVFYLNHCHEDRIWEAWMARNGRAYRPTGLDPEEGEELPVGHLLDDTMVAIWQEPLRPADVLDPSGWYTYDDLDVV